MVTQVQQYRLPQRPELHYERYLDGQGISYYDPNIYSLSSLPSMSYLGVVYDDEEYTQIGCAFGVPVRDDHSPCGDGTALLAYLDWLEVETSGPKGLPR
jgi:hypothetical protein